MNKLMFSSKVFLKKNASTILTCMGGAGVIATAVSAVKATPKALRSLEAAETAKGADLTTMEIVQVAGPAYIPSVIIGAGTIICIFGANVLSKRQQAAIMSAYTLLDSSYKDYKKKVNELYGTEASTRINEEIAKDNYDAELHKPDGDKRLFYDAFSKRYFESTIETVGSAEYHINRDLSMRDWATVNEFYEYLGLEPIEGGDEIGWSSGMNFDQYWQSWIDFGHQKTLIDDDLECIIITMFGEPTLEWNNYS